VDTGQGSATDSCKHGNEPSVFIKDEEYIDYLWDNAGIFLNRDYDHRISSRILNKTVLVITVIRDNIGAAEYICGDRCPPIHTRKCESMVPAVRVISRVNPGEFSVLRRFGVGCLCL